MHVTDMLIHVNETLGANERESLQTELRKLSGVIAPRFNRATPHLLLVSYNPQAVDSVSLLNRVKADGYHVQLVGM